MPLKHKGTSKSPQKFFVGFCTLVFLWQTSLSARSFTDNLFISPGLTIGYTFGAGINYGYCIDAGLIKPLTNNSNVRYGISFSNYFVKTKKYTHRLRSISVMGQTDFADLKVGLGRARNKWGRANRCITHGISYDFSIAAPFIYSPWIGIRHFVYERADWAWFSRPYTSLYAKYKFDIYQNTPLKKSTTDILK